MSPLLILLAIGLIFAPDGAICGSHHETTLYTDTLIRVVLPAVFQNNSMDPYRMPKIKIRSESDHRVTVKGKFEDGLLSGLSKVHRIGQCSGPAGTPQGNITFNCTIGLDKLNLTYEAEIKYGILPHSDSIVTANFTRAFGVMEVTANSRGTSPSLTRLTMATMGQFDHAISGGVLRGQFEHLSAEFSHRVIQDVRNVIEGPFKAALAQGVASSPLPSGLVN